MEITLALPCETVNALKREREIMNHRSGYFKYQMVQTWGHVQPDTSLNSQVLQKRNVLHTDHQWNLLLPFMLAFFGKPPVPSKNRRSMPAPLNSIPNARLPCLKIDFVFFEFGDENRSGLAYIRTVKGLANFLLGLLYCLHSIPLV